MKNKTKLKIFDFLAYGVFILLGLLILFLIIGAIFQSDFLVKIAGLIIGALMVFFIIFYISMFIVCIATKRWGYLLVLIVLVGVVVAHLFYFKVYRKTLRK